MHDIEIEDLAGNEDHKKLNDVLLPSLDQQINGEVNYGGEQAEHVDDGYLYLLHLESVGRPNGVAHHRQQHAPPALLLHGSDPQLLASS